MPSVNTAQTAQTEETFQNGAARLYRRSIFPLNQPRARLLIIHGYGDHSGRYAHFMQWMAEHEIACEAVDLRGQGRSPGRRGAINRWEDYLDDVQAFFDRCESPDSPPLPRFLLGHSHGGLIVSAMAERGLLNPRTFHGIILTSPFFKACLAVPVWKRMLSGAVGRLFPSLHISTGLQPEWMSSDPAMIEDSRSDPLLARVATPRWYVEHRAAQHRAMNEASLFTHPLLCLAGGADPIADAMVAEEFVARAGSQDKTFRLYPGFRHEILREARREEIFQAIHGWMGEHLG